jgi:putative ABC transport system permease protein
MTLVSPEPRLGVALVLLAALAVAAAALAGLGTGRATLTAAGRAVLQLTVLAAVLTTVLSSLALSALFVAVMAGVAAATAGRRITRGRTAAWALVPVLAGVGPVLAVVLGAGVVPPSGLGLLPVAGIVIGGTMTATALAGRRALDELRARAGEYEAALSIGLDERQAGLEICRTASALALIPPLDQTRTVGLVTLPGAFVGVLLGGGSAADAGAAQLLVLVGLLAAETIAVAVTLELVVRGLLRPALEPR